MFNKIKFFLRGKFIKNTLTLSIGTGLAQVLPMLFYPVLGRLFTPGDFGLLATITSVTSILVVLGSAKYENSILITSTKKDAAHVVILVLSLSLGTLFLFFILLELLANPLASLLGDERLNKWLFISPVSALAIIIYKTYNEWAVRNQKFLNLSGAKVFNSASTTFGKVGFGLVKISSNGLILGDVLGRIISAGGCIYNWIKTDKKVFSQISFNRIFILAKRYKNFPRFFLPGTLLDTINSQLPIFFVASLFLSEDVGYYSMAGTLLSVPASVISLAIMDVFRQRANEEWQEKGNCKYIYNKTIKLMFILIVPIALLLMFILPSLFTFVLGEEWYLAGVYARILLPNVAILFMFQVVSSVFIIANRMKSSMIWQLFSISLTVASLYLGGIIFNDIKLTLICFVIARCIANITRFYLTYKYSKGFNYA